MSGDILSRPQSTTRRGPAPRPTSTPVLRSFFALALAPLLVACSGGSPEIPDAASSTTPDASHTPRDAAVDAHRVTRDATADARDAHHIPDAPAAIDSAEDGGAPFAADATLDSPSTPDAPPPPICPGARDVLTLSQATPGGPLGSASTATLTNLDALWSASSSPLTVTATPGSGLSTSLTVTLPFGATLVPGTYPQGSARPDGGPAVDLSVYGNECQETSGTFTLANLTSDDAGVSSVLATFALACGTGSGQTDEVTGCVRYQAASDALDAGTPPPDATDAPYDAGLGTADAGALAPCLGEPQALYVTGAPVTSAPETVTGAEGSWSAGFDGIVMLSVEASTRWELELGASEGMDLTVGQTYTGAGILPGAPAFFALLANGVDCGSPNASFTVYDYADTGGDEATVTRLAATFTATCTVGGTTGTVTGCVHYVE